MRSEMPDQQVCEIVWHCLGYRQDDATGVWEPTECFPKWKERFPEPPDVIGVTRVYTKVGANTLCLSRAQPRCPNGWVGVGRFRGSPAAHPPSLTDRYPADEAFLGRVTSPAPFFLFTCRGRGERGG